ncbi:MAG: discoidin domain-containing protein [Hoeflea sp.]|jgi:hypothetical protein|uniref:discoidin domain-containing protein n=1 Tax=Hoeflea sp. TaxID=1940281 RepID=UPI0032EACF4E
MSNSPLLGIPLLSTSQAAKEATINAMVGYLERAGNDSVAIDMDNGNLTLPALDYYRHAIFKLENVGATSTLTVPATKRMVVLDNRGNVNSVTVASGGGSNVVSADSICAVFTDGSSVTIVSNSAWSGLAGSLPSKQPNSTHAYWRVVVGSVTGDGNFATVTELTMKSSPNGVQLATGGTAIASGQNDGNGGPSRAFDGLSSTRWVSESGQVSVSDHWVGYQFAAPVAITSISITCSDAVTDSQPLSGTVEFSDDGSTWYEAWEFSGFTWTNGEAKTNSTTHPLYLPTITKISELDDVLVASTPSDGEALVWNSAIGRWEPGAVTGSISHRYWRIFMEDGNSGVYLNLMDVEFRRDVGVAELNTGGTPLHGGLTGGSDAAEAFDGTGTIVGFSPTTNNYIGYDFGESRVVREVAIKCGTAESQAPKTFYIEWSDDNSTWTQASDTIVKDDWADSETITVAINVEEASEGSAPVTNVDINDQTASYTLVLADAGKYVRIDNASANDLTVPPNSSVAFPVGTILTIRQVGAGQTTIVEGSGVTVNTPETLKLRKEGSTASLVKVATDEWDVTGDLELA